MSHIRVVRNKAGNCINFVGTTNPAYWNACLSAQVDSEDPNAINVINDIRSATSPDTVYEFYRIPYSQFSDRDGNPFADAQAAADYITQNANVATNIGADIAVTPQDHFDFQRDVTNTTIFIDNGDAYSINELQATDAGDGTLTITKRFSNNPDNINVMYNINHDNVTIAGGSAGDHLSEVVNALNALFTYTPLGGGGSIPLPSQPTDGGVAVTGNDAEGTIPVTGNPTHLLTASSDTSGHGARYWSDETIDEAGEYYTVKITGRGRFIIGLGKEEDDDRTEIANNSGAAASGLLWSNAFYNYGSYIAPWTTYGSSSTLSYGPGWNGSQDKMYRYNTDVQDAHTNLSPVLLRVGIDQQGYIAVWYFDVGRSNEWIMTARRSLTTEAGNYFLVVKLWDGNATLVETPLRFATDPSAPALNYRYIESPDTVFTYPLFASADEAAYVDLQNGGVGVGSAHVHVYPDDPTASTWYMPNNGGFMDVSTAPISTVDITYTEIPTLADNLYGPAPLPITDYTLTEAMNVNIQIAPQDVAVSVTGLENSGLTYSLGYISGTAAYVIRDTDFAVSASRSNPYGTTTQNFTITIQDNESLSDLAGFTETQGNFVQPNRIILTHDALLQYDTQINPGEQLTYSYSGGSIPPTIGILSGVGTANLAAFDPDVDVLGTVQNVNNFAQKNQWDLRYVSFGGYIGGSSEKFALTGWTDNSTQPGSEGTLTNSDFKLEYGLDGIFRLYVDNSLRLTGVTTFTGPQTLTFAAFEDQRQTDVYVPINLGITTSFNASAPPAGFVNPVESGQMTSPTLFGPDTDGAVFLSETLKVNHRYIVPRTWIEANVLPYITGAGAGVGGEMFFFGVPRDGADLSAISLVQDFRAVFRLEGGTNAHYSRLYTTGISGTSDDTVQVASNTSAFYDYAIEWDGTDLHVIACNLGDINTQPAISQGGVFSRVTTLTDFGPDHGKTNQELNLVIAIKDEASVNLSTVGLQQIRTPWSQYTILHGEASNGNGQFGQVESTYFDLGGQHAPGALAYTHPTINAGYTYTYIYHPSMEAGDYMEFRLASDNTVYTTGVTTFDYTTNGDPSYSGLQGYKGLTFTVPQNVPPLRVYHYNEYQSGYFDAGRDVPISGSTYYVPVGGVTQEGPSGNQTGNNWSDQGQIGWISLNEPVAAGERITLPAEFFHDLISNSPGYNNTGTRGVEFRFGFKDTNWSANGNPGFPNDLFEGGVYLHVVHSQATVYITLYGDSSGTAYSTAIPETNILGSNFRVFFEITNSGNSIRAGSSTLSAGDDIYSTTFSEWSNKKVNTGDQGFGITELDFMMRRSVVFNNTPALSLEDIDFDVLSEVAMPQAPAPLTTSWNKALDFGGSSERLLQVVNNSNRCPIMMGGAASTVAAPASGQTTANGHPWATAIVFQADGNSSNQHIWNLGEGSGSTNDNIHLRLDSTRRLQFGWGRTGEINECKIYPEGANSNWQLSPGNWYGIYIAHNGTRLSGADASAANLADCFDIRLMGSSNNWGAAGHSDTNLSTAARWTDGQVGGRMDRQFIGYMTIGGRGANRNFHGKVASMVVTTLRNGVQMPSDAEVNMMIRDPFQWLVDYKVGNDFRLPWQTTDSGFTFSRNDGSSSYATQVWLMGDGDFDAYAQIRNATSPFDQNTTPMNMISMVSNDIETVNIPGLT